MVNTHKNFVLCAREGVIALEKGESDEETADDVQHQLGHQVRRAPPVVREIAHEQHPYLVDPRSRESGADGGSDSRRVPPLSNDRIDLTLDKRRLGGVGPDLVPIFLAGRRCSSTNDIEDKLGPVRYTKTSTGMPMSMEPKQTYGFSSAPQ